MMLNVKYATAWTYYDRAMSMNVTWNSKLSSRNYSTCILFIPSEVTVKRQNHSRSMNTVTIQALLPSYSI
jgi:hypothetical protein